MGDLISGIWGLQNGDPTKRQENQLGALGGYDTTGGEALTSAAEQFDLGILSGDSSKVASTLAPEISGQQQQIQQQAKSNAEFGTRSGGTAASTNAAEAQGRGNILNLEGGLQQGTAANAGSLGSNLLSQATGNINDQAGLASNWAKQEQSDVGGIAKGAAEIAAGAAGGVGGAPDVMSAGGADPLGEGTGFSPTTFGMGSMPDSSSPDLSAFA